MGQFAESMRQFAKKTELHNKIMAAFAEPWPTWEQLDAETKLLRFLFDMEDN